MRLWRISDWTTLDGAGGLTVGGRWHHEGRPIVYLAESSALAILEVLVRLPRVRRPEPYQLLEVEASGDLPVLKWPDDQAYGDKNMTAAWGDDFLRAEEAALARVPSIVAPQSWNYLLNPLHADAARVTLVAVGRWPWDTRLFDR